MKTDSYSAFARRAVGLAAFATAVVALSCADPSGPGDTVAGEATLAKGGAGSGEVTVSAASPDTASQGATLDVTISGSGFTSDMGATWELDGVADPTQVRTNSTRYVSPKQLVANVTIAEGATVAKWDVRVTSSRCCKGGIGIELFEVKFRGSTVTDPTATWLLPLDDEGLAFRSDGQFSDGTYSVYANGVCGVGATIFATAQKSNSGDGTIQTNAPSTGKGKKANACGRSFTLHYPDGFTEAVLSFNNLRKLQNTETVIPIGATVKRQLILNPSVMGESRCGRLLWGEGDFGGGVGSDSVLVTRLNARTWHVQSQPAPKNKAWCRDMDGALLDMPPVSFRIVAGRDLP